MLFVNGWVLLKLAGSQLGTSHFKVEFDHSAPHPHITRLHALPEQSSYPSKKREHAHFETISSSEKVRNMIMDHVTFFSLSIKRRLLLSIKCLNGQQHNNEHDF